MAHEDLQKHRDEDTTRGVDFSDRLASGDSVATVDEVEVTKEADGLWEDVSAEFGNLSTNINGDVVEVDLGPAAANDEQVAGWYRLFVRVTTTDGKKLVGHPLLRVDAVGDADAA